MKGKLQVGMAVMLVAATCLTAEAQVMERRGFIGYGVGPSTAAGAFRNVGGPYDAGGNALSGFTSTLLNVGYRFGKRWGVAGAMSYTQLDIGVTGGDD